MKPYKKTIKQIEHMTLFDDVLIRRISDEQNTYFVCSVTFDGGDTVLATGPDLQSAIDNLNSNMQWYVNNC